MGPTAGSVGIPPLAPPPRPSSGNRSQNQRSAHGEPARHQGVPPEQDHQAPGPTAGACGIPPSAPPSRPSSGNGGQNQRAAQWE
eukprot:8981947-Heterocapsa_arctica.AAC.1